jgi:Generalcontrol nonderepressible 1 (Gcn1) N-terminal
MHNWVRSNHSVLIPVQLVKSEGILNITITVSPKPSFLLTERIYTKLTAESDQLWSINALEAAAMRAITEMESAWPIAAIYFIANPKLSRKVRSAAKTMLENVVLAMPPEDRGKGADVVMLGVEEWLRQVETPHTH